MMKRYISSVILIVIFGLSGCDLSKYTDKIEREVKRVKHQYSEDREETNKEDKRPFTMVFQEDDNDIITLISSQCSHNQAVKYVYYKTQVDAHNSFLSDTHKLISYPGLSKLKPFWDIRYVDPVSMYMNGSNYDHYPNHGSFTGLDIRRGVDNIGIGTDASRGDASGGIVQLECINGTLVGGTTINLFNAPEQYIHYAGPQSTFAYRLGQTSLTSPWKSNGTGNLMIQGYFDKPLYFNFKKNIGGGVYMGLFIRNKRNGKFLNFVIGVYSSGTAWIKEKRGIKFDPTTNIVHVATVIKDSSWWSTKSPWSRTIGEVYSGEKKKTRDDQKWDDFYRVNISYQNLLAVLQELKKNPPEGAINQDFGLTPQNWEVTSIMIQYELEETGGKAILSGSFRGFEAYLSKYPL